MQSLVLHLLTLGLLLSLGCSKDQEVVESSSASSETTLTEGEDNSSDGAEAVDPSPSKSVTGGNIDTTNLPVGKQRNWTYATGQRADLDRAYVNQPVNVFTNAFGMPSSTQAQENYSIWFYDKMKVNYQGTNYSKVNVIVQQDRVTKITVDPRSTKN